MGQRKVNGRCAEQHRTEMRKATFGTGVFAPRTESELAQDAAQARKFTLRGECGDALCGHARCARARKQRADAARRTTVEPGRCGKPTRKGTCRGTAGDCPVHDRRKPPAFAW